MNDDLIICWDTETGGLPKDEWGLGDPRQPKLVSIAATLYRPDQTKVAGLNLIVRPDLKADGTPAWTIPDEAARIHGITTEIAMAVGVPLRVAVAAFTNLRRGATESVAHNSKFDVKIIEIALSYMGVKPASPWPAKMTCTCTDEGVVNLVKAPATAKQKKFYPDKKYKTPNLTELHTFLFKEGFAGAHGAAADSDACARCFFELRKRGVL